MKWPHPILNNNHQPHKPRLQRKIGPPPVVIQPKSQAYAIYNHPPSAIFFGKRSYPIPLCLYLYGAQTARKTTLKNHVLHEIDRFSAQSDIEIYPKLDFRKNFVLLGTVGLQHYDLPTSPLPGVTIRTIYSHTGASRYASVMPV